MTPTVQLRAVVRSDLATFFEHQLDPVANHMAAFTAADPSDRAAFEAKWKKILGDQDVTIRTVLVGGQVAGHVLIHGWFGEPEVTYWIGREFWGRGVATAALRQFLREVPTRPLVARTVTDNVASLHVLRNCGFELTGEGEGYANARGGPMKEHILRLEA